VRDTTDAQGGFSFAVPVGSYTVVEVDSLGWRSTTPNVVEVTLASEGDIEKVEFGDVFGGDFGTITGTVFLDNNYDGVWDDTLEPGIPDVPIRLASGDSTVTNGDGTYSFTVVPGSHRIYEMDLEGYTSSTPNTANVHVFPDSTVEVNFGDLYDASVNFTVVTVGNTDRALSIAAVDLHEDDRADPDIILGTEAYGSSNLHVWHNQRRDASSAIVSLFQANPTFSRNAGDAVQSTLGVDINQDGVPDGVTGLASNLGTNLLTWVTQTAPGFEGTFPPSPTQIYTTNGGTSVLSIQPIPWPGYGGALAVGTAGTAGGHVEIWIASGDGAFVHRETSDLHFDARGMALGKVTAIAAADFNRDGYPDLAVGQDDGTAVGRVSIFLASGGLPFYWQPSTVVKTEGAVLAMDAVDMQEDDQHDVDLVLGTAVTTTTGVIELWHNNSEGVFGAGDMRSDWIDAGGAVLSLSTVTLDPDVFPDVVAGTRSSPYLGALSVYRGFGYLPSHGAELSFQGSGEVATLTVSDFNIDGLWDIAAGTRTALSTGELVIYFGTTDGSAL
jgi:hypothetical protein